MKSQLKKELERLAKQNEIAQNDILRQSDLSTFQSAWHNMQVEASARDILSAYKELEEMERAELQDNLNLERKYGRANKKR